MSRRCLLTSTLLLVLAGRVFAEAVPLVTDNGGCELVLDTSRPDGHDYLVIASLGEAQRATRVTVTIEPTDAAQCVPVDRATAPALWHELVHEQAQRQE